MKIQSSWQKTEVMFLVKLNNYTGKRKKQALSALDTSLLKLGPKVRLATIVIKKD